MIVDLDIHGPAGFNEYRENVGTFLAQYGGTYLVRGGEFEVIEGNWERHRLVLFQFPDRAAIRRMFADPDYKKLAELRFKTATSIVVAVDGMD